MLPQRRTQAAVLILWLFAATILASCGSRGVGASSAAPPVSSVPQSNPGTASPGAPPPTASAAQQGPVLLLIEENHSFEQVMGNLLMPYLNSLAQQGSSATQYYAATHPSIGNYFMLTTGALETNDNYWAGPVTDNNLARALLAGGRTWKSYVEDLPFPGYLGSSTGEYLKHHNPFTYFSDVVNNPAQAANIVPFNQFASDVASGTLPAFSLLVPNSPDDAHGCLTGNPCSDNDLLTRADQWLKTNIAPLLASSQFQKSGVLVITFDESTSTDVRGGGGRVPWIAVGSRAKAGAQSSASYAHQNTLKTICELLGVSPCPGAAAAAAAMDDLVQR